MKVLFFVNKFPSISETFVMNQVTGLIDKGHDVRVFSYGKTEPCNHEDIDKYKLLDKTWYLDDPIPYNKIKRVSKIFPFFLSTLRRNGSAAFSMLDRKYGKNAVNLLIAYIANRISQAKWEPDVVISHFGDNGTLIDAIRSAKILPASTKYYTIFHAHEICRLDVCGVKKKYGCLFNNHNILLPINKLWEKKLIDAGAARSNVKVFRMGIDPIRFSFRLRKLRNDTITILSVGRLCGQKGYEYAIPAVAELIKKTNKKVIYKIIGEGKLETKLKKLVADFKIEHNVIFMGAQPQQVVAEEMDNSDIFLLPSVIDDEGYMEGIPVALMEAMARGMICVSTFHSGIPELIDDGINGLLCKERDVEGLAKKLLDVLNMDSENICKMSINAFHKIDSDFNIKKLIEDLDLMIKENK